MLSIIVPINWLKNHLLEDNVRIIDCRFTLGEPSAGEKAYKQNHIPGAVYFDLEKDLSGKPKEHGGRHPLPSLSELKEKLETAGIDGNVHVVLYDNGEGQYASRFWWLLTYLGHQRVSIVNGGYRAWINAKYPIDNKVPNYKKANFPVSIQSSMLATIEDVKENMLSKHAILIDSRAYSRFAGIEEPIDKKPGHIPGAINKEWMEGLKDGYWKEKEQQIERFTEFNKSDSFIVYCGSGVTATPNIVALMEAGFSKIKLYVGSYSDWVSYDENPIEKV